VLRAAARGTATRRVRVQGHGEAGHVTRWFQPRATKNKGIFQPLTLQFERVKTTQNVVTLLQCYALTGCRVVYTGWELHSVESMWEWE